MSAEQAGGTPGSGAVSERMRALLSRAAEEQLLEQRQVSTVLGELRALVTDVDERLATGEQVERVAEQVQLLTARLDAAEARSAELAERIQEATALVGQAAQDLVAAVAARVGEQLAELAAVLGAQGETRERRLAGHVDDAVLALAEVVLRRGRPVAAASPPAPAAVPPEAEVEPVDDPVDEAPVDEAPVDEAQSGEAPADEAQLDEPVVDAAPDVPTPHDPVPDDATPDDATEPEPAVPSGPDGLGPAPLPDAPPAGAQDPLEALGDVDGVPVERVVPPAHGYVLVPADVVDAEPEPAPPVEHERRAADRRSGERSDGSGRRRRPWWRPA